MEWVRGFLYDRKQYVSLRYSAPKSVMTVNSEVTEVSMGVPQGSILGPVLFLLYVNDIDKSVSTNFTIYADDISIILSEKCDELLKFKCDNVIDSLRIWFQRNSLYLNMAKTFAIRFHNRQIMCNDIEINTNENTVLSNKEHIQFLGMHIDFCLSWKNHCEYMIRKINSLVYQFRGIRCVLGREQLLKLYYAEVESRIRYGVCFWGDSTLSSQVFIAQKKVIRAMAGVPSTRSCKPYFKMYKVLTVPSLLIFELCMFVFCNKSSFTLVGDVHAVNTRQKEKYYIPSSKLSVVSNSPKILGLKIYNNLP